MSTIALLYFVAATLGVILRPLLGEVIDWLGERTVLAADAHVRALAHLRGLDPAVVYQPSFTPAGMGTYGVADGGLVLDGSWTVATEDEIGAGAVTAYARTAAPGEQTSVWLARASTACVR